MTEPKRKPLPLIPWDGWRNKLGVSFLAITFSAFFFCLTFWTSFDTPVSRVAGTCRLQSWGFWQPNGKGDSARIVARCLMKDNSQISLSQPIGWTPPELGSDIAIEIVNYRLSGISYYVK